MKYSLFIERYALKQMMKLDKSIIPILKNAISKLSDNPRPSGYIKLKGEEAYRIRVRDFRIIYEIDDRNKTVTIVAIGHRKNIYK